MWQPEDHDHDSSIRNPHIVTAVPSSSTSSPFSTPALPQTAGRTMEDLWKDIGLGTAAPILDPGGARRPCFHNQHDGDATRGSIADANLSDLRGMILQDFLGRPFNGASAAADSSVQAAIVPAAAAGEGPRHNEVGPLGAPGTVLSLNSGVDFQHLDAVMPGSAPAGLPSAQDHSAGECLGATDHCPRSRSSVTAATFSDALGSPCPDIFSLCGSKKRIPEQQRLESSDALGSPCPDIFSFCGSKKRVPEQQRLESSDGGRSGRSGDRRHKRMIKNRESAARSRARKQAYTNELELEVNHLTKENERLRRQHEKLRAKLAAQLPTKKALQRSSTAPF